MTEPDPKRHILDVRLKVSALKRSFQIQTKPASRITNPYNMTKEQIPSFSQDNHFSKWNHNQYRILNMKFQSKTITQITQSFLTCRPEQTIIIWSTSHISWLQKQNNFDPIRTLWLFYHTPEHPSFADPFQNMENEKHLFLNFLNQAISLKIIARVLAPLEQAKTICHTDKLSACCCPP